MKTFTEYLAEKEKNLVTESADAEKVVFTKKSASGSEWRIVEKTEWQLQVKKEGPKTKWTHYLDLVSVQSGKEMIDRSEAALLAKQAKKKVAEDNE